MIKVVRGNPTPEELAAALTVVRARAAAASAGTADGAGGDGVRGAWADPARVARTRLPAPGPGAWGRTFWPS